MAKNLEDLSYKELLLVAQEMKNTIASLEKTTKDYEAQIRSYMNKLYKGKSEKTPSGQLSFYAQLFNEVEAIDDANNDEEVQEEIKIEPKRKKKGKNKKHINYGVVEKETIIEHELPVDEQKCKVCGSPLRKISSQVARVELVYHKPYYERVIHKQAVYECVKKCEPVSEGPHGDTQIIKAPIPKALLPKSSVSPSLMASIVYNKFEKSLPLYRQETEFNELGVGLTRQTMANWLIRLNDIYLKQIIEYMKKELKKSQLMLIDETRVEVLKHPDHKPSPSNSYVWVARTGKYEEKQIVLFEYKKGREYEYAKEMVENYEGMIQTDGYQAYDDLKNIHIGCWQHTRRKFTEVLDTLPENYKKEDTQAFKLKAMIDKMYRIERRIQDLGAEERRMVRQAKTKKLVDDFFEIVHENYDVLDEAPGNEKFKKAISYAYLQEEKLRRVIEYGEAELSTNQIETTIRNFAIGRNNWMFFNTISGAKAGTALYSIIVTAKENGLKVYDYLEYLFDQIRNIEMNEEELSKIMPWSKEIPEAIKKA